MRILAALFIALIVYALTSNLGHTRNLHRGDALQLIDAGTIVPIDRAEAIAMSRHPGSTIIEIELERRYGVYIYEVELRDPQGVEWELELDATDGLLRKDHQDI